MCLTDIRHDENRESRNTFRFCNRNVIIQFAMYAPLSWSSLLSSCCLCFSFITRLLNMRAMMVSVLCILQNDSWFTLIWSRSSGDICLSPEITNECFILIKSKTNISLKVKIFCAKDFVLFSRNKRQNNAFQTFVLTYVIIFWQINHLFFLKTIQTMTQRIWNYSPLGNMTCINEYCVICIILRIWIISTGFFSPALISKRSFVI